MVDQNIGLEVEYEWLMILWTRAEHVAIVKIPLADWLKINMYILYCKSYVKR